MLMFYLHTDNTAPAAAVLAFINCLVGAAQSIKPQDSPHTVSDEAHLQVRNNIFNKHI